jgi:tRNA 2-thiouridine synthesizing protein C
MPAQPLIAFYTSVEYIPQMKTEATLIIINSSPFAGSSARTGIELMLTMAAFERPVNLLLKGEGIGHLLPLEISTLSLVTNEAKNLPKIKNHALNIVALPLYGIAEIYVDGQALNRTEQNILHLTKQNPALNQNHGELILTELDTQALKVFVQQHKEVLVF